MHNSDDGLTVNFNNDYPGGVTLFGVAGIFPKPAHGPFVQAGATPNLSVHGGLDFVWDPGTPNPQVQPYTVSLQQLITELQDCIAQLEQRVHAPES